MLPVFYILALNNKLQANGPTYAEGGDHEEEEYEGEGDYEDEDSDSYVHEGVSFQSDCELMKRIGEKWEECGTVTLTILQVSGR